MKSTKAALMDARLEKLFDRMEENRAALLSSLEMLSENQLAYKPEGNRWSINEVIQHLVLSEQGTHRYLMKKNQAASLPRASLAATLRSIGLTLFMRLPVKFKMPARANAAPGGDVPLSQLKREWEETRQNLRQFITELPPERQRVLIFRHPFMGYFNIYQTLRFIEEHIRHHLKQIRRIREWKDFPVGASEKR